MSWQKLISYGKTRALTGTRETMFHGPALIIEKNTLSIASGDCFIPLDNIGYVRKGLVAVTTKPPLIYMAVISVFMLAVLIARASGALTRFGSVVNLIGILLPLVALGGLVYITIAMTEKTNHYGLLVGVSSNVAFSFISTDDQVTTEAYNFLKKAIGEMSFNGSQTFDFGGMRGGAYSANSSHADASDDSFISRRPNNRDEYKRASNPPATTRVDFDPKQFIDELIRSIDEIQYSQELTEQQRHQLIHIMMEAKNGVERSSHREVEQSRVRFREFAYKTKQSWPQLMSSFSARPNMVKFFSAGA